MHSSSITKNSDSREGHEAREPTFTSSFKKDQGLSAHQSSQQMLQEFNMARTYHNFLPSTISQEKIPTKNCQNVF